MLTKNQIEKIKNNEKVIFTTSSKTGQPRSIYVVPSRIEEKCIILSSIQMKKSFENVKENSKCFINVYFEDEDLQYKIEGTAEIFDTGELFEEIKEFEERENLPADLKVNAIIVIDITTFEESIG